MYRRETSKLLYSLHFELIDTQSEILLTLLMLSMPEVFHPSLQDISQLEKEGDFVRLHTPPVFESERLPMVKLSVPS